MKEVKTEDIKNLIPNECDTITTKEIAEALGISTSKAYNLCLKAEAEGWLFKFGYKEKDGYRDISDNEAYKKGALTWQHSQNT